MVWAAQDHSCSAQKNSTEVKSSQQSSIQQQQTLVINSAAAQWTCQIYQVRTYVEKTCKSQNNEVKLLSWD